MTDAPSSNKPGIFTELFQNYINRFKKDDLPPLLMSLCEQALADVPWSEVCPEVPGPFGAIQKEDAPHVLTIFILEASHQVSMGFVGSYPKRELLEDLLSGLRGQWADEDASMKLFDAITQAHERFLASSEGTAEQREDVTKWLSAFRGLVEPPVT